MPEKYTPDDWWLHTEVVWPNGQVVTDWADLEYIGWCQQVDAINAANKPEGGDGR